MANVTKETHVGETTGIISRTRNEYGLISNDGCFCKLCKFRITDLNYKFHKEFMESNYRFCTCCGATFNWDDISEKMI